MAAILVATLVGLRIRIAAKITAYTYALLINQVSVVLMVDSKNCGINLVTYI